MNAPGLPVAVGNVDRRTYIGGSDIAGIMGLSPWQTPLQVWERKRAAEPEVIDEEKRKFFARRKRQEPVIAEMLADEFGVQVTRLSLDDNPNRYIDPEHPFLAAEIDFEFLMSDSVREHFPDRLEFAVIPNGTLLNGEIKTVHPFKASEWGEEGSEDVPIHYAAQGMYGLGITRRPAVLVAALFGLDTLLCFPVMADPATINGMREKAVAFWRNHIIAGMPPDPSNTDDVLRMYLDFNGKPVNLSDEAFQALQGIGTLRRRRKQIDDDMLELEWRVARCVAFEWGSPMSVPKGQKKPDIDATENAVLLFDGHKAGSWSRTFSRHLDQKRLGIEHPEIIAEFTLPHQFRVFRLSKGA